MKNFNDNDNQIQSAQRGAIVNKNGYELNQGDETSANITSSNDSRVCRSYVIGIRIET